MRTRTLLILLAATLVGVAGITTAVIALEPVAPSTSLTSSGREGGFDQPRVTASPTPTPAPVAQVEAAPLAPAAPPTADPAEAEVLAAVNVQRAANGCPALAWDEALAQVARAHSADMAARDYMEHTNPDGLTPFDRAAAAGTSASAENIAAGQQTAAAAMESWMNSPGHRDNILNCSLTRLGVGVGYGGSYGITWTQLFGS